VLGGFAAPNDHESSHCDNTLARSQATVYKWESLSPDRRAASTISVQRKQYVTVVTGRLEGTTFSYNGTHCL
jgi:hypothetical protein